MLRDRSGAGVLEYGLILGLVAMVAIGAILVFGGSTYTSLTRAGNGLGNAASYSTIEDAAAARASH